MKVSYIIWGGLFGLLITATIGSAIEKAHKNSQDRRTDCARANAECARANADKARHEADAASYAACNCKCENCAHYEAKEAVA